MSHFKSIIGLTDRKRLHFVSWFLVTFLLAIACTRVTSAEESVGGDLKSNDTLPGRKATEQIQTLRFQQGIGNYNRVVDTEMWAVAPTKVLDKQGTITSDADNGGGESQILIRFEDIIGNAANQIPRNARILSARFSVTAFDPGSTVYMHRVLIPWSRSTTWNTLSAGISADDIEATKLRDGFTFGDIVMDKQSIDFDVSSAVQFWVNGAPNNGWVFINTGGNGWDFYSSDWHEKELRPWLEVKFSVDSKKPALVKVP